ncbi:MAG: STAS domain-containing protein [Chlorobi bacterium]|jgi:anti-sigma B factor antagonist|nr:STAS domain-containing protein [Chlorobiota bacterium]
MEQAFRTHVEDCDDGVTIVELHGYLDASTAFQLDELFGALHDRGVQRIVVECSGLEYISSAGLGVFMAHIEPFRAAGGDIRFCALNDRITMIVEMLGFPHIFRFYPDRERAVESYRAELQ